MKRYLRYHQDLKKYISSKNFIPGRKFRFALHQEFRLIKIHFYVILSKRISSEILVTLKLKIRRPKISRLKWHSFERFKLNLLNQLSLLRRLEGDAGASSSVSRSSSSVGISSAIFEVFKITLGIKINNYDFRDVKYFLIILINLKSLAIRLSSSLTF